MMRPKLIGNAFPLTTSPEHIGIKFNFRAAVRKDEVIAAA
jgi:hypothetical protein